MKKDDKPTKAHDPTPRTDSDVTDSSSPSAGVDGKRRTLLRKTSAATATAALASWLLPKKWQKPAIDVVGLPVHAQTSPAVATTAATTEATTTEATTTAATTTAALAMVRIYNVERLGNVVVHSVSLTGATGPIGANDLVAKVTFGGTEKTIAITNTNVAVRDMLPSGVTGTYTSVLSSPTGNVVVPESRATHMIPIT